MVGKEFMSKYLLNHISGRVGIDDRQLEVFVTDGEFSEDMLYFRVYFPAANGQRCIVQQTMSKQIAIKHFPGDISLLEYIVDSLAKAIKANMFAIPYEVAESQLCAIPRTYKRCTWKRALVL